MTTTLTSNKETMNANMFYTTMREKALRYLTKMGLSMQNAEDVYGDAVEAFIKTDQEKDKEYFDNLDAAFLFSICKNQSCNKFRFLSRHAECSLDAILGGIKDEDLEEGVYACFSDEVDENDRWYKVEKAMRKLSENDQQILLLYYWENLSMAQIAKQMGYKNGDTVKAQKYRIMRELKPAA